MRATAQMLQAPWRQSRNEQDFWSLGVIAALALLPALMLGLPFLGLKLWGKHWNLTMLYSPAIALLLLSLWAVQFASLYRQNHPTAARLVPGHLPRLRGTAVGLWLLLVGAQALVLGLSFGHAAAWGVGAGLLMLLIALGQQWPMAMVWSLLLPALVATELWPFNTAQWEPLMRGLDAPVLLAGCLLLGAGLLCALVQSGNQQHGQRYARKERERASDRDDALRQNHPSRWRLPRSRYLDAPYYACFRAAMAHAQPTERSALARLDMGLGPDMHWTTRLRESICVVLGTALLWGTLYFVFDKGNKWLLDNWHLIVALTFQNAVIAPLFAQHKSLYRTRQEQALLMLAPGMPQGVRLNKGLARRQISQSAIVWAILCGLALLGTRVLPAPFGLVATGYAMTCIPVCLWCWRDWSRVGSPGLWTRCWLTIVFFGAGAGVSHAVTDGGWSLWLLFPAMLALTLAIGTYRWRKLAHYPQALPVGRLWQSS